MAIIVNEVLEIPEAKKPKRCTRSEMLGRLNDIMSSNVPKGLVMYTDGEYTSITAARASLQQSAKHYGYDLKFETRSNKLYFRRTDIK